MPNNNMETIKDKVKRFVELAHAYFEPDGEGKKYWAAIEFGKSALISELNLQLEEVERVVDSLMIKQSAWNYQDPSGIADQHFNQALVQLKDKLKEMRS